MGLSTQDPDIGEIHLQTGDIGTKAAIQPHTGFRPTQVCSGAFLWASAFVECKPCLGMHRMYRRGTSKQVQ